MSNTDGIEDLESEESETTPKALRDQNKALAKANKELLEKFSALEAKTKATDIAEFLKGHGAKPSLAKYASKDIDTPTADTVLEWLTTNGEDFGWEPDDAAVDEDEEQAGKISRATSRASSADGPVLTPEFLRTASREQLKAAGAIA